VCVCFGLDVCCVGVCSLVCRAPVLCRRVGYRSADILLRGWCSLLWRGRCGPARPGGIVVPVVGGRGVYVVACIRNVVRLCVWSGVCLERGWLLWLRCSWGYRVSVERMPGLVSGFGLLQFPWDVLWSRLRSLPPRSGARCRNHISSAGRCCRLLGLGGWSIGQGVLCLGWVECVVV
jgi:hypothetical protein